MLSHDFGEPLSAAASRMASSALTAARAFTTRESAMRETPSRFANSVTVRPPFSRSTVSARTSPRMRGIVHASHKLLLQW
jgi:hypothetical protein